MKNKKTIIGIIIGILASIGGYQVVLTDNDEPSITEKVQDAVVEKVSDKAADAVIGTITNKVGEVVGEFVCVCVG